MAHSDWAIVAIALLSALPGIIAAVKSSGAKRSSEDTKSLVQSGVDKVDDVQRAVGPANGENVQQALVELKSLHEYAHQRNHDIIDALAATNLRLDVIGHTVGAEVPPLPDTVQAMIAERAKAAQVSSDEQKGSN